jgi:hypothetical protein
MNKNLILIFAAALVGCKNPKPMPSGLVEDPLLLDAPVERASFQPHKVEYVVGLTGKWAHDLYTTESLSEAYEYYDKYVESHGNMTIFEVKYIDGNIVRLAVK